jgi:uncharacterized protein YbjT (DUF2867 family)
MLSVNDERSTVSENRGSTLVLGATGKTGSRVADKLKAHNVPVRRAAPSGADVAFDWDEPRTYDTALEGIDRIYLLGPRLRADFATQVHAFLDRAEAAGASHVTYLSIHDRSASPSTTAQRAVERDLESRDGLTNTILRPAWFMQNFDNFLSPVEGEIAVPTGDGVEAFVHVEDVAAVATATLLDPAAHHGAHYTITGQEALTIAQAAEILSDATGEAISHFDVDPTVWVSRLTAAGIPSDYVEIMRALAETIATCRGAQPTDVVARITATPARSFAEFARETAAARAHAEAP